MFLFLFTITISYCNVACVLDYEPLLYKGRCTIIIAVYNNHKPILLCTQNVFVLLFLSGVPAWQLLSVQHNGGFLPGIILLTQCYYSINIIIVRGTNPFKYHKEVLHLQPMIPPNKPFDIFPPDWRMLRMSRCVQIFIYKQYYCVPSWHFPPWLPIIMGGYHPQGCQGAARSYFSLNN